MKASRAPPPCPLCSCAPRTKLPAAIWQARTPPQPRIATTKPYLPTTCRRESLPCLRPRRSKPPHDDAGDGELRCSWSSSWRCCSPGPGRETTRGASATRRRRAASAASPVHRGDTRPERRRCAASAASPYTGVSRGPSGGGWMARVLVDPERGSCRAVGPFPDPHAAALAHDRVAIAYLGDRARPNFPPAFHPIEQRFLRLCREREGQIDVCALVADPGTYEARYATFLRSVLRLKQWGDFKGLIVEFFISRASEIGDDILKEGGERLEARFSLAGAEEPAAGRRRRATTAAALGRQCHRRARAPPAAAVCGVNREN
ncbi:LOW QUALITY PROTEIN: hypothetical protein SORBI_3001G494150 [Sorghum bicolor]|uniref:AP2/ERF domain-containing protein n=1 Tax=Sorghum bicolor TaxID=4558 RepID=A0A1Z5SB78_SORBI|nr:LOW QUALITY PROTEIN: hypothetical protein SORBI_3001G494150 [Sorghum bicolor]